MTQNVPLRAFTIVSIVLVILSPIALIHGILMIVNDDSATSTSGPIALSDGCCFGSLWIIGSCLLLGLAWLVGAAGFAFFPESDTQVEMISSDGRRI